MTSVIEHKKKLINMWPYRLPVITMEPETWADIFTTVLECGTEISWFSKISVMSFGRCHITGMAIPYQECNSRRTVMDGDILEHLGDMNPEYRNFWCWGHSHVRSAANMSKVDERNIHEMVDYLGLLREEKIVGPWISIVLNKFAQAGIWVNFIKPSNVKWEKETENMIKIKLTQEVSKKEMWSLIKNRRERLRKEIAEKVAFIKEEEKND